MISGENGPLVSKKTLRGYTILYLYIAQDQGQITAGIGDFLL